MEDNTELEMLRERMEEMVSLIRIMTPYQKQRWIAERVYSSTATPLHPSTLFSEVTAKNLEALLQKPDIVEGTDKEDTVRHVQKLFYIFSGLDRTPLYIPSSAYPIPPKDQKKLADHTDCCWELHAREWIRLNKQIPAVSKNADSSAFLVPLHNMCDFWFENSKKTAGESEQFSEEEEKSKNLTSFFGKTRSIGSQEQGESITAASTTLVTTIRELFTKESVNRKDEMEVENWRSQLSLFTASLRETPGDCSTFQSLVAPVVSIESTTP